MKMRTWAMWGFCAWTMMMVSPNAARPQTPGKPAAVINGHAIPAEEVEPLFTAEIKERFKVQPPSDAQRRQVRQEIVESMMDEHLRKQICERSSAKADPAEVEKRFQAFADNLKKDKSTLAAYCQKYHLTEARVRADIADTLKWENFLLEKATDENLRRYWADNKDFFDNVMVKISHIVIRLAPDAPDTDRQAAKQKLLDLRKEIVAGKLDFAEAAKKHSQCPSAPAGGDLGFCPRRWILDEAFAKTAFALPVGDISDVVTTEFGVHLIKATDRNPGQPSEFEKIKDRVRNHYLSEQEANLLAAERKKAKIEINLP